MQIDILYEDNHLLVVNKPINMPVQADDSGDLDLQRALKDYLIKEYNKPGEAFLAIVHRIDRPVGGAIIFAKTSKAAARLSDQMRRRAIKRSYYAVCYGSPKKTAGQLVDYIAKNHQENKSYIVKKDAPHAQKAILNYQLLDANHHYSLLKIDLETGRPHQIRAQFAHMGHPLYGDQKYGQEFTKPGEQIALWACELSFKHPTKDEIIHISSQPPRVEPWTQFGYFNL